MKGTATITTTTTVTPVVVTEVREAVVLSATPRSMLVRGTDGVLSASPRSSWTSVISGS